MLISWCLNWMRYPISRFLIESWLSRWLEVKTGIWVQFHHFLTLQLRIDHPVLLSPSFVLCAMEDKKPCLSGLMKTLNPLRVQSIWCLLWVMDLCVCSRSHVPLLERKKGGRDILFLIWSSSERGKGLCSLRTHHDPIIACTYNAPQRHELLVLLASVHGWDFGKLWPLVDVWWTDSVITLCQKPHGWGRDRSDSLGCIMLLVPFSHALCFLAPGDKGFPLSSPSCIIYLLHHRPKAVWAEIYETIILIWPLPLLVVLVRHLATVIGRCLARISHHYPFLGIPECIFQPMGMGNGREKDKGLAMQILSLWRLNQEHEWVWPLLPLSYLNSTCWFCGPN